MTSIIGGRMNLRPNDGNGEKCTNKKGGIYIRPFSMQSTIN